MQQFLSLWRGLTPVRKAVVVGATLAIFLAVLGMSRLATRPNMSLLYAGLDPAAAGQVVDALQQQGVAYEVRGTSIFVDSAGRDQVRLSLAGEGLPARSGQGYELLDGLSGFGTTSQMFDATYLRAKEGELARTILASPDVASARVHIATGSDNPFRRDLVPKASVHIVSKSGTPGKAQVQAFRHLVAAAVSGMKPEDVSVIDSQKGLLSDDANGVTDPGDAERAAVLRDRALRLVEARVGHGNAVVEVSVDTITEAESITERSFDPDSRFVISSDSEDRSEQSDNAGSGAVTVASNLPDGDANGSDKETRQSTETRERLNYEVSQTTREIVRAPGAIKRLTVAVLVNGKLQSDAAGTTTLQPLPEDELAALRELVASAVGFDENRGDVITLRSMVFEPSEPVGTAATAIPWYSGMFDLMTMIKIAILAVVALILGLFVVRPLLLSSRRARETTPLLPSRIGADVQGDGPVLTGIIEPDETDSDLPVLAARSKDAEGVDADPVARLKALIEERRGETVEVLRSWLDEPRSGEVR